MKVSRIFEIMDLAWKSRQLGDRFTPMFRGGAGLGKSEVVQQWVAKQRKRNPNFGFIDLRVAYYEAPDLVGYCSVLEVNGVARSVFALPEIWPTEGEGLALFEEPNRGTTGVMNCLMQVLTDRQVGTKYKLPPGWMMAACVNPDDANYDVNAMDTALTDRFEIFDIEYDPNTFIHYIEDSKYDPCIVRFIKSGAWTYKSADSIAEKDGGKYISPRTWSKLNAAERAGCRDNRSLHRIVCQSILGKHVGNEYWKSCWDDAPVTAQDILNNPEVALSKLSDQCKPDQYQGDRIAVTVESIVQSYGGLSKADGGECTDEQIDENLMAKIAMIIPSDQALVLIRECGYKSHRVHVSSFFRDFTKRHPECVSILKSNIRVNRADDAAK